MALTKYNKKRNFENTSEPEGKVNKSESKLIFVVQRHKASRLHYDFRLELDGVLKSWAVPKGPSLNPKDKRLAMMVEDHPYDYKDFAGVIPEGNYGAGIVEIWDQGTYSTINDSTVQDAEKQLTKGLKSGDFKFRLSGKKLKGEFVLVKLKKEDKEDNSWLLIKHNDEFATAENYDSEEETPKNSPINKWLADNKSGKKKALKSVPKKTIRPLKKILLKEKKFPGFIKAMLAKESVQPFDDAEWIFEMKWDGYRAIAKKKGTNVSLYSRNGLIFNHVFPIIVEQLKEISGDAVLDGEIIVLDEEGLPNFQYLQGYAENQHRPIQYQVFDLVQLAGKEVTKLPLLDRKELLKKLLPENKVIRYSEHIVQNGKDFFELTGQKNLEGIMAKKADSFYYPGRRTTDWLKIKHHKTMDAIIVGYTEPTGSRKYFGALILATYKKDKLNYIGHTGTGFNERLLKEIYDLLQLLIQKDSPFTEKIKTNTRVTWLKPEIVCEVKYSEITKDGILRHPVFLHIRMDKNKNEVKMDNTKEIKASSNKIKEKTAVKKISQKSTSNKTSPQAKKNTEKSSKNFIVKKDGEEREYTFGKNKVTVTHPDKLYFPEDEIRKGDVVDYYISMSEYILPHLKGRPQSLLRNPNGIHAKGFFHKDAAENVPSYINKVIVHSESNDKEIDYIVCDNEATLVYMNNLGCIEINPWPATVKNLENPDYMIIDIDPSDKNTFDQVVEVALTVKDILDKAGADSFCKTSGASGLHIYVPTAKKYSFEQVKDFALIICTLVEERLRDFTTLERSLSKRSNKKIYLDYLQNRRGQTLAAVYSLRPKGGATVSTPLLWEEVQTGLSPKQFTMHNIKERVDKMGDLFKGVLGKGIDLNKCLKNLGE